MTEEEAALRLENSPLKLFMDYLNKIKEEIKKDLNTPIDLSNK